MRRITVTEDDLKKLMDKIDTILAVETLEYHDKNWLSGDNKTRNEEIRRMLYRLERDISMLLNNDHMPNGGN